jgi:hypothetical protein
MRTISRDFLPAIRSQDRITGLAAAFLMAAAVATCALAVLVPAHADGVGPLSIAKTGHFLVGGKYVDSKDGPVLAGQAYVEYIFPPTAHIPIRS